MALSQLPSVPALVVDLGPSFSSVFSGPWREARQSWQEHVRSNASIHRYATSQQRPIAQLLSTKDSSRESCNRSQGSSGLPLPEFLRSVPITSLEPGHLVPSSILNAASAEVSSIFVGKAQKINGLTPAMSSPRKHLQGHQGMRLHSPQAMNHIRTPRFPISTAPFSTSNILLRSWTRRSSLPHTQQRSYNSSSNSTIQSMLAHAERTANNNANSASAQAAFYSALLRANMFKIIIERYQTGRYATNPIVDAAYLKALEQNGSLPAPGSASFQAQNLNAAPEISPSRLQAIGSTVAAQSVDDSGAIVTGKKTTGTGARDSPLHVVVDQSKKALVFRMIKFLVTAGFTIYFLLVLMSLALEMTGLIRARTSQNHEVQPQKQKVRFDDVHGCDEAKDELQELVDFLLNPDRFSSLGGKLPKGVLLVGPPGTGKTMLARAVAGEAGCPFFYMSGSEFDEMYVGVGAKRVRELFAQARSKAPAIIFIDELDAVGGKRHERDPAYAKQTLNQLLTELDGFSPSTGVILIAATNYPQSLDKALTRPGRFDRRVQVSLPDVRGRVAILKHYMSKVAISPEVDASVLARGTPGFSGAELENLVNQAAVHASRKKLKKIGALELEWAKDKIMMGAESRSRIIREKDRITTAYHEAGHALVNILTPGSHPLHKMTIMPRGPALGITHMLPDMDAVSQDYQQYLAEIDVAMGGRAAEQLIYGSGHVSSGISNDLSQATRGAYALVTQYGFSEKLGNVDFHSLYDRLSSETKQEIENEMRTIVEDARKRAESIIKSRRHELELLKDALMEYETLTRDEILQVMRGEKLKRLEPELQDATEAKKDDNGRDRGGPPQPPAKPKDTGKKGGVGISLPGVLLPPGTRREEGES